MLLKEFIETNGLPKTLTPLQMNLSLRNLSLNSERSQFIHLYEFNYRQQLYHLTKEGEKKWKANKSQKL